METYKLVCYQLVREDVIRDEPEGDIIDWKHTVIAESQTVKGLLKFAKLKKLQTDQCVYGFFIESYEKEYMHYGGWLPTSGNIFPRKSLEELI